MVERRHRIIQELGMTMLFHSGAPLFLWVEAFSIVVYLINHLPSFALNSETPYFALHVTHPDYTSLHIFGSKCFPYTWDTRQHKFDPKIVLCVFVINIKDTSAFISQAKKNLYLTIWFLMNFFSL